MMQHHQGNAWDRKEFDKIFDLFEEDEPGEQSGPGGLDKGEFTLLVKRIA